MEVSASVRVLLCSGNCYSWTSFRARGRTQMASLRVLVLRAFAICVIHARMQTQVSQACGTAVPISCFLNWLRKGLLSTTLLFMTPLRVRACAVVV